MLWYVHACVGCSTYNNRFQVLFLFLCGLSEMRLNMPLFFFLIWTRRGSGWLQYRWCTYYDDCAITSVFLFWKSENLEEQICNKVYIFLLHFVPFSALCSFVWVIWVWVLGRLKFKHFNPNLRLHYKLPYKSQPHWEGLGIHPWSSGSETQFPRRT